MRNLFLVFILACFLISCTDGPAVILNSVSLTEQKELTTIEMQEKVKNDKQMYKVVHDGDFVYLVNPDTNLVEKKVSANEDRFNAILNLILLILLLIMIFI
jgi:hypothetical protein